MLVSLVRASPRVITWGVDLVGRGLAPRRRPGRSRLAIMRMRAVFGRGGRREAVCSVGIVARQCGQTPTNVRAVARNSRYPLASGMSLCHNPYAAPIRHDAATPTTVMAAPPARRAPPVMIVMIADRVADAVAPATDTPAVGSAHRATTMTMIARTARGRRAPAPPRVAGVAMTIGGTNAVGVTPAAVRPAVRSRSLQMTAAGAVIAALATKTPSRPAIPTTRWPFPRSPRIASKRRPMPTTASRLRRSRAIVTAAIREMRATAAIPPRAGDLRTLMRAAMTTAPTATMTDEATVQAAVARGAIVAAGAVIPATHACLIRWTIRVRHARCATATGAEHRAILMVRALRAGAIRA